MLRRIATRSVIPAALAITAAAGLTMATAPAAQAVGEHRQCTTNWGNFGATVAKNAWNYRTGPSTAYRSLGYLNRGDKVKVFCSKGSWNYSQLTQRSRSGMPKGTKGWVRNDGLLNLAG
ncbi:SH3 domain-containing protein [Streptomyces sp. NPDC055287]